MEITCLQMDVLISFYIEGDLSESLKEKVEEHLKKCPICRAKFNIISSLFSDIEVNKTSKNRDKISYHPLDISSARGADTSRHVVHDEVNDTTKENNKKSEIYSTNIHTSKQYQFFKKNLSAYIDNELSEEENVKIRKYAIGNKKARKELEDTYHIRKLMRNSFKKNKSETKPDFSKNIMKQINTEEKNELRFNPLITVAFAFVISVLIISTIVIYIMSL